MKRTVNGIKNYVADTDKTLWVLSMMTSGFGLLVIASISLNFYDGYSLLITQAAAFLMGIIAAVIISKFDYRVIAESWKLHATVSWFLVILTYFVGYQREGTDDRAWLYLGSLSFQPSELAKISFILTFALHLEAEKDGINNLKSLFKLALHAGAATLAIYLQGDAGSALVFLAIAAVMVISAGLDFRLIIAAVSLAIISLPLIYFYVLSPGKQQRILTVFFPELDPMGVGWQQTQGKISIGNGEIFGIGLFDSSPREIPEVQNDFIFTYIGETLGFIGCVFTILILVLICVKILRNGLRCQDSLGAYICTGFFAMLAFQIILNIGMCLGVLPVIGLPLPFISQGGSAMLTAFIGIGIIISVYTNNRENLFYD